MKQITTSRKHLYLTFFLVIFAAIPSFFLVRNAYFKGEAKIKAKYQHAIQAWKSLDSLKFSHRWSLRNISEIFTSLTSLSASLKSRSRNGPRIDLDVNEYELDGITRPFTDLGLQPDQKPLEAIFTFGAQLNDSQFNALTPGPYDLEVSLTKDDEKVPFLIQHYLVILDSLTIARLKNKKFFHRKFKSNNSKLDRITIPIF